MVSPELLRRFRFFGGLSDDELRGIAMISEEVSFPENTLVFGEDEHAENLYLIISGNVELLYNGGQESPLSNAYVGSVAQGEILGVSALIEPYQFSTSARTEGPTNLIAINAAGLLALCQVDPRMGYILMSKVAKAVYERLHASRIQLAVSKPA